MLIKNIEAEILNFLKERGWDKLRPSDLAKSVSIEAAELLEVFQWVSLSIEETKNDPELMGRVKNELADVFIYAFQMIVLLGLDTEGVILEKLKLVKEKYPAGLMKKNIDTSISGESTDYRNIKKRYRS